MNTRKSIILLLIVISILGLLLIIRELNSTVDAINKETYEKKEKHSLRFSNLEFIGKVKYKEPKYKSYNGYYLHIRYVDFEMKKEYTLPCELYDVLPDSIIVCRVTEEDFNSIENGDTVKKIKGSQKIKKISSF